MLGACAGAAMLYRGLTGRNPLELLAHRASRNDASLAPSYQNEQTGRSAQLPDDEVDEASMESFPASDPPGHTGTSLPR
jgi:hypothetical protein